MTQEEKAKRYDEALEELRGLLEGIREEKCKILEEDITSIFPELQDSEDEKIRKDIIEAVELHKDFTQGRKEEIYTWLEKQGEQKPQGKTALEAINEEKVDNADKVEPKFHEGEWLCENEPNNYARFIQILEIVNVQGKERYRISRDIHNDEDIVEFDFVEKYYHKFDIEDAKDGDVLYTPKGAGVEGIFLIEGWKQDEYAGKTLCSCIGYRVGEDEIVVGGLGAIWWEGVVDTFYPATKEQRDKLEKEMADAGYTFDFEKKELKKIENEIEIPYGAKDSELMEVSYNIPKGFHAEIDKDKVVIKKGEKQGVQPRYNIGDVICDKSCTTLNKEAQPNMEIVDIQNGMYICDKGTFPVSQQDEYELVSKKIDSNLNGNSVSNELRAASVKHAEKELKNHTFPNNEEFELVYTFEEGAKWNAAQKHNWSEEDENIKEWIMSDINKLLALNRKSFVIADKEIIWLKSLKDRVGCEVNYTTTKKWRASWEQLDALEYHLKHTNENSRLYKETKELYDQLKKL